MKVSGVTVLRNVVMLDYPFLEAIRSALPICDEFIVVVGDSDDGTLEAVRGLSESKIRVVETVWSDKVRPRDCLLAQQTNIGLHLCQGDWAIYLQANEVLHESALPVLVEQMKKQKDNFQVEALLLERLTFWGDYRHVITVYPHRFKFSPRIVRPYVGTYSIRDAMSVAVFDNFSVRGRYPRAVDTGENVFRYGHVRNPEQLEKKARNVVHTVKFGEEHLDESFFYKSIPKQFVRVFSGSHPKVMRERIEAFDQEISMIDSRWRTEVSLKERQRLIETWFYERFGFPRFRNTRYDLIGRYVTKPRVY